MRREYFEVISLSTVGLGAHFWDLNAYVLPPSDLTHGLSMRKTTAQ
jgi:hypothetical protein